MSGLKTVSILLPTFYPRPDFLAQQLASLDEQDYPALELLILDDSADSKYLEQVRDLCRRTLAKIPYQIWANERNLGVNRSFEKLVSMAKGDIIAFCDQDDIWEKEKISRLVYAMDGKGAQLAYSRASLIDARNKTIKPTWKSIGFSKEGSRLYRYLVGNYSIGGNRMIVVTELAQKAMPFSAHHSYDHWVALISSCYGRVAYLDEPLIRYRLHDANTLGMHRVISRLEKRSEYVEYKILAEKRRCDFLIQSGRLPAPAQNHALSYASWVDARLDVFRRPNLDAFVRFVAGSRWCAKLFAFEFLLVIVPAKYVKRLFRLTKQKQN